MATWITQTDQDNPDDELAPDTVIYEIRRYNHPGEPAWTYEKVKHGLINGVDYDMLRYVT